MTDPCRRLSSSELGYGSGESLGRLLRQVMTDLRDNSVQTVRGESKRGRFAVVRGDYAVPAAVQSDGRHRYRR